MTLDRQLTLAVDKRRKLNNDVTTAITIVSFGVSVAGFALGLSRHSDLALGVGVTAFVFAFSLTLKSAQNRRRQKTK